MILLYLFVVQFTLSYVPEFCHIIVILLCSYSIDIFLTWLSALIDFTVFIPFERGD